MTFLDDSLLAHEINEREDWVAKSSPPQPPHLSWVLRTPHNNCNSLQCSGMGSSFSPCGQKTHISFQLSLFVQVDSLIFCLISWGHDPSSYEDALSGNLHSILSLVFF